MLREINLSSEAGSKVVLGIPSQGNEQGTT